MTSTARNRPGPFGIGTASSNNVSNKGFASGFGNGSAGWNNNIWSGNAIGSGMKNGAQDSGRGPSQSTSHTVTSENHSYLSKDDLQAASGDPGTITGSGSLLSSSESDGFNIRHGAWKSIDDTSPGLSRVHTNTSGTSPIRRQNSNQLIPQPYTDTNSTSSAYFSATPGSTALSSRSSQKNFLDPTSGAFESRGFDSNTMKRTSRHNSDEENKYTARKLAFEGNDSGLSMRSARPSFKSNVSGYNSSAASRSDSLPPSRTNMDTSTRHPAEYQNQQHPRSNASTVHRPNLSAQAPAYTMPTRHPAQRYADQLSPSQLNQYINDFGTLSIGKDSQAPYSGQSEVSYETSPHLGNGYPQDLVSDSNELWSKGDSGYPIHQGQFSPTGSGSGSLTSIPATRRGIGVGAPYSNSSNVNDGRLNHQSPYYSAAGTPPTYQQRTPSRGGYGGPLIAGQAAMLDRKLQTLQQEQQYLVPRQAPMQFNNQFPQPSTYDFRSQPNLRMNQLHSYYPISPATHHMATSHIPRGPANDHAAVQPVRSALLEEFRNNSKTNKRYELKDIYDYIVEFSGDQHGSRFIQQKLETANSDEKDQVFRELHPNAIQLMTDVFGNYVIQKFFEHGNQYQKKSLANQMRTHILTLSTQMYGCRVVQKALEHILTDQQAQLVRELEHHVLKCVKDQNGNHVVQKAIERVPAEHIQFILNAFTGQVQSLATHPYGCRVIQRMLEHCEEPTQNAVLQEIHAGASSLILDQFGNYVAQHIIEHGRDEDRAKLINLVISQLANFSKHKFASNVVEKSIQHGSQEEREKIVATLTVVNEKGESPSQCLIRDQYGNYVIQKVLNELKGSERDEFVELIKAQLALLKRFSYGKQIAAIEKLIYTTPYPPPQISHMGLLPPAIDTSAAPTPPLLTDEAQSPQSSSLPSTHANSVEGQIESRKSSGSNALGVLTPTST